MSQSTHDESDGLINSIITASTKMLSYHQPTPLTTGSQETWTQHSVFALWSLRLRWTEKFHSNYTV